MNRCLFWIAPLLVLALLSTPLRAQDLDLVYSTFLGGSSGEEAYDLVLDDEGQIYVTGITGSADFPTLSGYQASLGGGDCDAFVYRLSSSGSSLLYSTYLGGGSNDRGYAVAVDAQGAIYIGGETYSGDFPTINPYQSSNAGVWDAFLTIFCSSGSALLYSTYFGAGSSDSICGLSLDSAANVYLVGRTSSYDFPRKNAYQYVFGGQDDAFVSKFSSGASSLIYSTFLGGSEADVGDDIDLDSSGCVYIDGTAESRDFPTRNPYQASLSGGSDIFVAKLASRGDQLLYSTYIGGSSLEGGEAISVNSLGYAYVSGDSISDDFPRVNPYQNSREGDDDAVVLKLSTSGSALVFATYLGGNKEEVSGDLDLDSDDGICLAGSTTSDNFPTAQSFQSSRAGKYDAFVSHLSSSGSILLHSTYLGGSEYESWWVAKGPGMVFQAPGVMYVAGWTASDDFPTVKPYQSSRNGGSDTFIAKLSWVTPTPTPSLTHTPTPTPWRLIIDADDYDGDGATDFALWRAADGCFRVREVTLVHYGLIGDIPVVGDYNGDSRAEIAVFRPASGQWFLRNPAGGSLWRTSYGLNGDIPVPADYNGDFRTDTAVWRPGSGAWYVRGMTRFYYGTSGDLPAPGDYEGDGTAEASVLRAAGGSVAWYVRNLTRVFYGLPGDIPVPGDYAGDGITRMAVFRPSSGRWYIRGSASVNFGQSGDIPLPMDADGDGTAERAVFRPSSGRWYIYNLTGVVYGNSGDQPVVGEEY